MASATTTTWSPENAVFWEATRQGVLLLKACAACGRAHYYPRPVCPFCASMKTEWRQSSGEGTIYSFSVVHRASPPYVMAYVTLAEGVTLLTHLVECDSSDLRIGQSVRVVFRPAEDGRSIPMFTPAEARRRQSSSESDPAACA
jgi:uncharacterized OB-fold protein